VPPVLPHASCPRLGQWSDCVMSVYSSFQQDRHHIRQAERSPGSWIR
jgi:hypothetical protein